MKKTLFFFLIALSILNTGCIVSAKKYQALQNDYTALETRAEVEKENSIKDIEELKKSNEENLGKQKDESNKVLEDVKKGFLAQIEKLNLDYKELQKKLKEATENAEEQIAQATLSSAIQNLEEAKAEVKDLESRLIFAKKKEEEAGKRLTDAKLRAANSKLSSTKILENELGKKEEELEKVLKEKEYEKLIAENQVKALEANIIALQSKISELEKVSSEKERTSISKIEELTAKNEVLNLKLRELNQNKIKEQ